MNSLPPSLFRAPPFPGSKVSSHSECAPPIADAAREDLFAAVREARVGGAFWAHPVAPDRGNGCDVVRREHAHVTSDFDTFDPWSVLPLAKRLIAHGGDEWVAIACVLGLEVEVLSSGPYGNPGDMPEVLAERAHAALAQPMRDPFSGSWLDPPDAIALLCDWRRVIDANRGDKGGRIVAATGISWWKRAEIRRFLWSPGRPLQILNNAKRALNFAQKEGGALAVWPSRVSPELIEDAKRRGVPLVQIEDGFIRSVGLGSNLVPPLSVVVDRRGIHFDPRTACDLESILANAEFPEELLERARLLRETIITAGISKYSSGVGAAMPSLKSPRRKVGAQRVVLVSGQVEDDMSVLAGGGGLTSNLELLRRARELEPDAEILWRPHPDVDAGHRIGAVEDAQALEYADRIVRAPSMAELLDCADAVHVLTSLSGFEALLRGLDVTCHGVPFYSGWGLTRDLGAVPDKRGRKLALDALVAGVLLLYPRYLDPVTGLPCPAEILVDRMARGEASNRLGWVEPVRRAQGELMARLRAVVG